MATLTATDFNLITHNSRYIIRILSQNQRNLHPLMVNTAANPFCLSIKKKVSAWKCPTLMGWGTAGQDIGAPLYGCLYIPFIYLKPRSEEWLQGQITILKGPQSLQ